MVGTYDDPREYVNEEKRRNEMLKKALKYMEQRNEDLEEMSSEQIVEAAENFENFVKEK